MIESNVSQYSQVDNINGVNGRIFLYGLNVIHSDENKYIKKRDNSNIEYYEYTDDNIKIIPKQTDIIYKSYDFTNYLLTHYPSEDMLEGFFNGLNSYLNESTGKIINITEVLEYIGSEETLILNDFLDLNSINNDITYENNEEISYYFQGFLILATVKRYIDIEGNILENNQINSKLIVDIIYNEGDGSLYTDEGQENLPSSGSPEVDEILRGNTATVNLNNQDFDPPNYSNIPGAPNITEAQINTLTTNINTLKKSIGEITILMDNPNYNMASSSGLVQIWVDLINNNIYTDQDIPNLSNLQQQVENLLNN